MFGSLYIQIDSHEARHTFEERYVDSSPVLSLIKNETLFSLTIKASVSSEVLMTRMVSGDGFPL